MTSRSIARARARAALVLFFFRAASGLVLAYPVARTVGAFLPQAYPVSDALLFAPGGVYAAEALRLGGRAIQASLEGSALVFVLVAVAASFPFAIALSALVRPDESLPSLAKRGARATPSLVALGGAVALGQAILLAAIAGLVNGLAGSFDSVMDERRSDLFVGTVALLGLLPVLGLGLVHDLARAAVVRHGVRSVRATRLAFAKLMSAPSAVVAPWLLPAFASVVLVLVAGWLAGVLDVARPGAARVLAVLALHQGTVVGLVLLRLFWLERALSLVDPPEGSGGERSTTLSEPPRALLADRPARSAAPDDPTPDPAS
ncbi:MAG TPA: hypothetical protein VH062_08950 [Polyangiaceae bacterium]|jgi:hypothetical protein|nr:hypothetical protein [Polyangiaceae bacterium]